MSPAEALKEARLVGRLGRFGLTRHAAERMRERDVSRKDIGQALQTANIAIRDDECWRLEGGHDLEGEPLTVVVVFTGFRVVVTVF